MNEANHGTKPGVPKTNQSTLQMAVVFESHLHAKRLSVMHNFIALRGQSLKDVNRYDYSDDRKALLEKLRTQIGNFKFVQAHKSKDVPVGEKAKFKLTGKNGAMQDDLAVACTMIGYWIEVFWNSGRDEYRSFQKVHILK
jgi:hypothetical protein